MAFAQMLGWPSRRSPATRSISEDLVLSKHPFHSALRRERLRSDSSLTDFSLLTLALGKRTANDGAYIAMADVIKQRVRATDTIGRFAKHKLGIILPDTPAAGAWKLASGLRSLLNKRSLSARFEVYAYPAVDSKGQQGVEEAEHSGAGLSTPSLPVRPLEMLLAQKLPVWKRSIDVVGAATGFVLAAPLMVLVASLLKLESSAPVFYRHERIGRHGRRFKVWKFRTMVADADRMLNDYLAACPERRAEWDRDHKLRDDPRVTKLGRWLRKSSVDELPQLWNVLRGEMSLVGPRPIVTAEIAKYGNGFKPYCSVPPGLTGLWQISGRNDMSYAERVELDTYYARNWSLWLDLYILVMTVSVVLFRRGAY